MTRTYKSIFDNDYSNEFFRQFDLLRENMKEVNFFLSVICKIIFNDTKYQDIKNLTNDDLVSVQILAAIKDKKEMDIMKEQFITNQKVWGFSSDRFDGENHGNQENTASGRGNGAVSGWPTERRKPVLQM